ncbi:MAG: WD40-like repeat-like protein [Verrucomicrobiales bacterium]|nr:WD40-like repeat-like protein [Verrucomicrobiales bacterium]
MNIKTIRGISLLFPPVGLVLILFFSGWKWSRRLGATLFLVLYSLIYSSLIVLLLLYTTSLEVEWRGGFPPVLTWHKTNPDYAALDRHRKSVSSSRPVAIHAIRAAQNDWPQFRGPQQNGISSETINLDWSIRPPKLLWKQPAGGGYGSFALVNDVAFTLEQRHNNEFLVAYDVNTGAELWTNSWPGAFSESMGGDGPRSTPSFSEGAVYALGAEGEFRKVNASTGKTVWRTNILVLARANNLTYGMASSPLVIGNRVILCPDGGRNNSVIALDTENGNLEWSSSSNPSAYSTPILANIAGVNQILVVGASLAFGLDPENGKMLWSFPWVVNLGNRNISQPIVFGGNKVFLSAGYGTGCVTFTIEKKGDVFHAQETWRNKNLKNKFTSSVFLDGFIYGLDEDILTCIDAQTGERKWKDGRFGYGQLIANHNHLIILSGEGELCLVNATPEKFELISRIPALSGKTWNYPAISRGKILVRNSLEMACFDLSFPK